MLRFSPRESALEEGWLLAELEQRFGYGLEELARRFDRTVSWVSRRLALTELLPQSVQQQVRACQIPAPVAMKFLLPVARSNLADCQRMAEVLVVHQFTTRQAARLYVAWRDAAPGIRQRILEQPELFPKAQRQVDPHPGTNSGGELLRDLEMVAAIAHRASRRYRQAAGGMDRTCTA
jgi:ParB family chromosome partitioning protein